MLAFSDAGSKLASVLVNFMYFHWEAIKRVKRATNTNKPILFLKILLAIKSQKLVLNHFNIS